MAIFSSRNSERKKTMLLKQSIGFCVASVAIIHKLGRPRVIVNTPLWNDEITLNGLAQKRTTDFYNLEAKPM